MTGLIHPAAQSTPITAPSGVVVAFGTIFQGSTSGLGYNRIGATKYQNKNTAAPASIAIVAPGSNVNGLILRSLFVDNVGVAQASALYSDTAAPASASDETKNKIFHIPASTTFTPGYKPEIYIPVGNGLYWWPAGNPCILWASYDLL